MLGLGLFTFLREAEHRSSASGSRGTGTRSKPARSDHHPPIRRGRHVRPARPVARERRGVERSAASARMSAARSRRPRTAPRRVRRPPHFVSCLPKQRSELGRGLASAPGRARRRAGGLGAASSARSFACGRSPRRGRRASRDRRRNPRAGCAGARRGRRGRSRRSRGRSGSARPWRAGCGSGRGRRGRGGRCRSPARRAFRARRSAGPPRPTSRARGIAPSLRQRGADGLDGGASSSTTTISTPSGRRSARRRTPQLDTSRRSAWAARPGPWSRDPGPRSRRARVPPWRSTRCFTISRPSPRPLPLLAPSRSPCQNSSKTCGSASAAMPRPLSRTSMPPGLVALRAARRRRGRPWA